VQGVNRGKTLDQFSGRFTGLIERGGGNNQPDTAQSASNGGNRSLFVSLGISQPRRLQLNYLAIRKFDI
jgi:hypothetical protein